MISPVILHVCTALAAKAIHARENEYLQIIFLEFEDISPPAPPVARTSFSPTLWETRTGTERVNISPSVHPYKVSIRIQTVRLELLRHLELKN